MSTSGTINVANKSGHALKSAQTRLQDRVSAALLSPQEEG